MWNLHDLYTLGDTRQTLDPILRVSPCQFPVDSAEVASIEGGVGYLPDTRPLRRRKSTTLEPAEDSLDWFARQIVAECGAIGALILWHKDQSAPQVIRCVDARDELGQGNTTCLEHAIAVLREAPETPRLDHGVHNIAGMDCISSVIRLEKGYLSITMQMQANCGQESSNCRAMLSRWLPFSKAFFAQWAAAQALLAKKNAMAAAINHTDIPTMLLGRGGALRFANDAAQAMLAKGSDIRLAEGRLDCLSLADTMRLQSAIAHVLAQIENDTPILVLKRRGRRPLLLALAHSQSNGDKVFGEQIAIAYIFDPEQGQPHIVDLACAIYSLSPCEARLAGALVDGLSLCDAAKLLRLREHTARSYLKQIFNKTETNRQAELVQLLLRSSLRMVASDHPAFL